MSGAFTEHGVRRMVEMHAAVPADRADLIARPMSIFTITATGNFRYSEDSCQNLLDCVEAGVPVEIVPVTLMGLIAPVTTVGATVFHTIDVLAGITMAQVIRPGAPVLFGGAPATFHMKVARRRWRPIEALQLDVGLRGGRQVARPADCQSYMALSDGPSPRCPGRCGDIRQRPHRRTRGGQLRSAGRACSTSCSCSASRSSCSTMRSAARPPVHPGVEPRRRPADRRLIAQLEADQHLIMADHTMAHWPTELHLPSRIWERDNRENWIRAGSLDTAARATVEVDRRLAAYEPVETDARAVAELERIIRSGLRDQVELPHVPPAEAPVARAGAGDGRRRNRRRGG